MKNITATETAKLIRDELKNTLPGVKASVRKTDYATINVYVAAEYRAQVDELVNQFRSQKFDTDLRDWVTAYGILDGETVLFSADYIFVNAA
jgi:hypothetical protein